MAKKTQREVSAPEYLRVRKAPRADIKDFSRKGGEMLRDTPALAVARRPGARSEASRRRLAAATPVERAVYQNFGLEPGIPRSAMIPVARDPETNALSVTAPQFVYDIARSVAAPAVVASGQPVDMDEEALNLALNFTGTGVASNLAARPLKGAVLGMSGARGGKKPAPRGSAKGEAAAETGGKTAATPKSDLAVPGRTNLGTMPLAGSSLISTRRPSEKNFAVFGNPDEVLLTQTGEGMRLNPNAFVRTMDLLTEEPFMADMKGMSPDVIFREGERRGADNLKFITEELMDPETVQSSIGWYPTANQLGRGFAARIGQPPEAGWAGIAATSPQTPWPVNVARIDRMSQMMGDQFEVDPAGVQRFLAQQAALSDPTKMLAPVRRGLDYVDRIVRSDFGELTDPMDQYSRIVLADKSRFDPRVPNISPSGELFGDYGAMTWGNSRDLSGALSMMQDPSMENIRATLTGGGKVPSFYDDIADPDAAGDIITGDTHSTGATGLFPAGANDTIAVRGMGSGMTSAPTGSKGYYGLISDAHNLAAKELGIPRGNAVQSITWEGVRDLWGSNAKTEALKNAVGDIWRSSSSPDDARFRIAELMGRPVRRVFSVR